MWRVRKNCFQILQSLSLFLSKDFFLKQNWSQKIAWEKLKGSRGRTICVLSVILPLIFLLSDRKISSDIRNFLNLLTFSCTFWMSSWSTNCELFRWSMHIRHVSWGSRSPMQSRLLWRLQYKMVSKWQGCDKSMRNQSSREPSHRQREKLWTRWRVYNLWISLSP